MYPGGKDGGGIEAWGTRAQLDLNFSDSVNLLLSGDYRDAEHGFSPQITLVAEPELDGIPAPGLNLREIQQGDGDPLLGQRVIDDLFKINLNDPNFAEQEFDSWGVSAHLTWEVSEDLRAISITAYREWSEGVNPDVDSGPGQLSNGGYGLPISRERIPAIRRRSNIPLVTGPSENEYFTQEFRLRANRPSHSTGLQVCSIHSFRGARYRRYCTCISRLILPLERGTPLPCTSQITPMN